LKQHFVIRNRFLNGLVFALKSTYGFLPATFALSSDF